MKSLLVFGEVLFDIIGEKAYLGGAPFNVAAHFAKHGNCSYIISSVGSDSMGKIVRETARKYGIKDNFLQTSPAHTTGTVKVSLSEYGTPEYDIVEQVAWDYIGADGEMLKEISSGYWDCFYFGTLAQRSRTSKNTLKKIQACACFKNVFFDVNLRQHYFSPELLIGSMQYCNILKLNNDEVKTISGLLFNQDLSCEDFAKWVSVNFDIELVIITLGSDGAAAYHKSKYITVPGIKIVVADTVGAGDSFSAAFLHSYLSGSTIEKALTAGCEIGALVASKHGAIPDYH